jgi:transcriptional regulator with XRE-family HTH domain
MELLMDPETQAVLAYLRAAIRVLGFTHREIARHLGVSRSYISRLLAGEKELRLDELNRICQVLDFEPKEFLLAATLGSRPTAGSPN